MTNLMLKTENFSVARSKDFSGHADLKDLCDHIETRLLLFQSSLDLFSDARDHSSRKPKPEQVEVSRPIETVTITETIDETPKPTAQMKKKKKGSALKSCLRVEQGTSCSTDGDVTAELSLTSGQGKSVDSPRSTVNFSQCDPQDDDDAGGRSGVDFSEVTVRTFTCRLGDNPSTRSGVPISISGKPLSTSTIDINKYETFVGRNRRRGDELLLSPQERSKMLMEEGYKLEEIAKIIIETEHSRQDRLDSMAKEQRWDKIRCMLSLKPSSSSFDLKDGADVNSCNRTMKKTVSQSPSKGLFVNLRKLKGNRSDRLPKCITVSAQVA